MQKLAALICLFTLAACGQQPAAKGAPAAQPQERDAIILGSTQNMPDWLLVLRTTDGGMIHFNQRAITRANGLADIWLQVRHGRQQLYQAESETTEQTVRYELERLHYRFNCAEETFIVVERQIMGANEQVIASYEPRQIWRTTPASGAARHVMPIACRGA